MIINKQGSKNKNFSFAFTLPVQDHQYKVKIFVNIQENNPYQFIRT